MHVPKGIAVQGRMIFSIERYDASARVMAEGLSGCPGDDHENKPIGVHGRR